eukprot:PhM_4_TR13471/c0_g1_i1/m.46707
MSVPRTTSSSSLSPLSALAQILPDVAESPMYDGVAAWTSLRPLLTDVAQRCRGLEPFRIYLEDNDYPALAKMLDHTVAPYGTTPLELLTSFVISTLLRLVHAIAQRRGHYHVQEVVDECYKAVCDSPVITKHLAVVLSERAQEPGPDDKLFVRDACEFEAIFNVYVFTSVELREVTLLGQTFKLSLAASRCFLPKPGLGSYRVYEQAQSTTTRRKLRSLLPEERTRNPSVSLALDGNGKAYAARSLADVVLRADVVDSHDIVETMRYSSITKPVSLTCLRDTSKDIVVASADGTLCLLSACATENSVIAAGNVNGGGALVSRLPNADVVLASDVKRRFTPDTYGVQSVHAIHNNTGAADKLLLGSVVRVFDVATGAARRIADAVGWHVTPNADGTAFFMCQPHERRVEVWDLEKECVVTTHDVPDTISSFAACPERLGNFVVGLDSGKISTVVDAVRQKPAPSSFYAHDGPVSGVAVKHGTIVSCGEDDKVRVWSWHRQKEGSHSYYLDVDSPAGLTLQPHPTLGDVLMFASPECPIHAIQLKLLERL